MATVAETRVAFIAPIKGIEWRESGNGEDFTLTGHAAVFDRWSEELSTWAGTFRERIERGAFSDVLRESPDVRLYYNHDGLTLARTRAKTLELTEDEIGLRVWARVAPTQFAHDLRLAMQRRDVDQMSFAFTVAEDEWHEDHEKESIERTIIRVADLYDVSVVAEPAYPDTDAAIRELREASQAGRITARETQPLHISHGLMLPGATAKNTLAAASILNSTGTSDTSRAAGGVSKPSSRLVALRAKGRRARLLTPETRKESP